MRLGRLLSELRRRRVVHAAAVYAAAAFVVVQAVDIAFPALKLPDWTVTFVVAAALAGFPLALALAWAYDITPAGVRRTADAAVIEPATTEPVLDRRRIAVLPFANISPDPADEYFADGMTEELISVLSRLRGLEVIARTSVMAYKAQPKPVAVVGRELRAGTLLEGSVRKAGDRVRITVQLIDATADAHL